MNYNHLFYFWSVARHGSVSKASRELHLSQPTISEQLRKLEESVGVKLFERSGRGLRLSDAGQTMFGYADQIFRLGREMRAAFAHGEAAMQSRLAVGVVPSLSRLVAYRLMEPALHGEEPVRLSCVSDRAELLFGRLALHQLDVVLADSPLPSGAKVRGFSHRLTRSGLSFMASRKIRGRRKFPQLLDGVRFLMPESNTRRHIALQSWFEKQGIRPNIVGEFSDGALLERFGQEGAGIFAVPTMVEDDAKLRHKLHAVGRTTAITEEFYAITTERRITHPAVRAIEAGAAAIAPERRASEH